ncbi:transglycosylase domain-containing protein [Robertkochia aurantiaca]|uniref:transglycosylase domain-containing protein n=1 Tax=Robertkochia aurantiaca TaxID=2873700 RepID=UPI001CCE12CE|nr:transglycosylase domain-containing protein [Robertkochia sp. 3YJGBD-33]
MFDKLKRFKKPLLLFAGVIFLALISLFASVYLGYWGKIPSSEELRAGELDRSTLILDNEGELVGKLYIHDRLPVSLDSLPPYITDALIATEDARFYEHDGVDTRSIFRVFFKTLLLQDRSSGGGSTLSQQLAKNLYPREDLGSAGIVIHKLRESIIASRLEKAFTKEEILETYLNTVSFGDNKFGIESASRHFFGKPAAQLTLVEAATLIGSLKATYTYNPRLFPEKSRERRNVVLAQMERYGKLSADSLETLMAEDLSLSLTPLSGSEGIAPYFRERVRREAQTILMAYNSQHGTNYNLYSDGLKIHTTLDLEMQLLAEAAMRKHMKSLQNEFEKSHGKKALWLSEKYLQGEVQKLPVYKKLSKSGFTHKEIIDSLSTPKPVTTFDWNDHSTRMMSTLDSLAHYRKMLNFGSVSIHPGSGAVTTWIGGIDFDHYKFDHVSQSKRQTGSVFKPLVYATALEQGIEPCSYYSLKPVTYENMEDWTPKNAGEKKSEDYINYSLAHALSNSVNTVAVKVLEDAGISNVIETAGKMGISSDLPAVPSLALGTAELSLIDMGRAYSSFINEGKAVEPYVISHITDAEGNEIYRHEKKEYETAFSESTRLLMLEMLKKVTQDGTASRLRSVYGIKQVLAGKTGTTQNNKDGWFIGMNPQMISVTWVGNDDHRIGFKDTRTGQGAHSALPYFAGWFSSLINTGTAPEVTRATFEEVPDEILESLACEPTKKDGFFKRLFSNPDKIKKKKFRRKGDAQ